MNARDIDWNGRERSAEVGTGWTGVDHDLAKGDGEVGLGLGTGRGGAVVIVPGMTGMMWRRLRFALERKIGKGT